MTDRRSDRIALAFALALAVLTLSAAARGFYLQCRDIRAHTLRLHIVANSDSEDDQRRKLMVRDAILAEYSPALSAGRSIDDAVAVTKRLTRAIELSAEKTLRGDSCEDGVKASVETMYFDTIAYAHGETLPAGEYTALRIVIGEGAGHNWWCVMYPPLCVPAAAKHELTEEETKLLELSEQNYIEAKFAVVELFEKCRAALRSVCG